MKSAVIIAIEDYRNTAIGSVKYARNDAIAFKELLIERFGVEESDILFLIDQDASKIGIETDVKL